MMRPNTAIQSRQIILRPKKSAPAAAAKGKNNTFAKAKLKIQGNPKTCEMCSGLIEGSSTILKKIAQFKPRKNWVRGHTADPFFLIIYLVGSTFKLQRHVPVDRQSQCPQFAKVQIRNIRSNKVTGKK